MSLCVVRPCASQRYVYMHTRMHIQFRLKSATC